MKQGKIKIQLIIISIIIVIFFSILFLSTNNKNVELNYNFKKNITLNYIPKDYGMPNSDFNIGELKIENKGILPSKVKLKKLVLCQISSYYGDNTYYVEYRGKTKTQYGSYDMPFGNYYNGYQYVEVSSKDTITLDIIPSINSYALNEEIEKYQLNKKTVPFYIFEVEQENTNIYSYCTNQKKEDAIETIYVTIDISQINENKEMNPELEDATQKYY